MSPLRPHPRTPVRQRAGHFYTAADFAGQPEADVEDLLDPALYVEILNAAYKVPASHAITIEKLREADKATPRIVSKRGLKALLS